MSRVLICDDEPDLAGLLEVNLRDHGFSLDVVYRGEDALGLARVRRPDLVVLDLLLPDISGVEVCRRLKRDPATAQAIVLMVTARGEEGDRVRGFEAGADDYVTKPFSVREVVLRVKALLRRPGSVTPADVLELGPIRLHRAAHRAYVEGHEVDLTALEFRLLQHLMVHRGRLLSREELLRDVWELAAGLETRTVDTHMMRLREKLGAARDRVETVRGFGYRMSA